MHKNYDRLSQSSEFEHPQPSEPGRIIFLFQANGFSTSHPGVSNPRRHDRGGLGRFLLSHTLILKGEKIVAL